MRRSSSSLVPVQVLLILLLLVPSPGFAWGRDVHRLINGGAVDCLPPGMEAFQEWRVDLEDLASEADRRKSWDNDEGPRHYIDIDVYPEFFAGSFPREYETALGLYGSYTLESNGLLPWAIEETWRNLVEAFRDSDWNRVVSRGADLGHYVGDLHNPMHLTENYNGQLTGQRGIHSRHESEMCERYLEWLAPYPVPAPEIQDVLDTVFERIDAQYPGVALVLAADLEAKRVAGGNSDSDLYYETLWHEVGEETYGWIHRASVTLASLWTAAWREAGSPALPGSTPVLPVSVTRLKTLGSAAPESGGRGEPQDRR